MKNIIFNVEKTSIGYSAYAEDYPVCTTGATMKELKANIVEAMNLYNEELQLPKISESEIVLI